MSDEYLYGHMLQEYYVQRLRDVAQHRAEVLARIRTQADLRRLQQDVRRKLRACFGRFPARTPLKSRTTGVLARKDYSIEKIIYESRPGFPVTANLYVPKQGRGPWPAVLGACGHSQEGKACDLYQAFCQNLARMGYLVLIYDPISQGERFQYPRREGRAQPAGCCQEHNMAGNQMALVGDFFGLWRAWDGIRGLDYLLSRPEADRSRVGVTGNSGGGTLSTYLTALDKRFTMAAPSCFVTTYLSNMENELPADSEQIPPGILAAGLDMADFFVAHLPRPTLLLGQNNDFFDRRGLEQTYEQLKRLYAVAGAEQDVELFIGPTNHGYSVHNREAMYRFFNKHAGARGRWRENGPPRPENPERLAATPKGQAHFEGVRRVFDFTRERANVLAPKRKSLNASGLRRTLTRMLQLPRRTGTPHYRVLRPRPTGRKTVWHSGFAVETEPGIRSVLHLFSRGEYFQHFPEAAKATLYVPHLSSEQEFFRGKAPRIDPVFALDVRGIGQLASRTCNDPDFFTPYGGDYFYASQGLMLAESYCGRRVHDVLSVLDLFEAKGYRDVHLAGRGLGALWATFAACLHPLVKRVTLLNALLSYQELTQVPVQSWPMSSLVFGLLKHLDLPDCYRMLVDKRLTILSPWDSQMRVWRRDQARSHLKAQGLSDVRLRWET